VDFSKGGFPAYMMKRMTPDAKISTVLPSYFLDGI